MQIIMEHSVPTWQETVDFSVDKTSQLTVLGEISSVVCVCLCLCVCVRARARIVGKMLSFAVHVALVLRLFCQYTPFLNLRSLIFRLTPFG